MSSPRTQVNPSYRQTTLLLAMYGDGVDVHRTKLITNGQVGKVSGKALQEVTKIIPIAKLVLNC